jgi:hypothetical protein
MAKVEWAARRSYIDHMATERIEFRPRKWRWLALISFNLGMTFWGSIIMLQNPDTLDHVLALLFMVLGIASLTIIPDLFRPWSLAVTREGIEVNASLFNRAPRFVPWRDVTDIDVQRPVDEGNQSIVIHVADGWDVWLSTPEFHRPVDKTLEILRRS